MNVSFYTANKLIEGFQGLGLLDEITGAQRNRRYCYTSYMNLFVEDQGVSSDNTPVQVTESQTNV